MSLSAGGFLSSAIQFGKREVRVRVAAPDEVSSNLPSTSEGFGPGETGSVESRWVDPSGSAVLIAAVSAGSTLS